MSVEIPSGSEMIFSYQKLCVGKMWNSSRWNSKAAWETHTSYPDAGRNMVGSRGLWRGDWSWVQKGTPQHCPASLAWRRTRVPTPPSGYVVLCCRDLKTLYFSVWSSHEFTTPPKYYFAYITLLWCRGQIILNYFLLCTYTNFVVNVEKTKIFSVAIRQV